MELQAKKVDLETLQEKMVGDAKAYGLQCVPTTIVVMGNPIKGVTLYTRDADAPALSFYCTEKDYKRFSYNLMLYGDN